MNNKQSFIQSIVSQVTSIVNQFAFERLKESGRFNPDDAYYTMHGETLGEYASSTFFGQLFSRKASF